MNVWKRFTFWESGTFKWKTEVYQNLYKSIIKAISTLSKDKKIRKKRDTSSNQEFKQKLQTDNFARLRPLDYKHQQTESQLERQRDN